MGMRVFSAAALACAGDLCARGCDTASQACGSCNTDNIDNIH
ncbi:hypothetical protein BFJ66_g16712 [Fusarium oxysporum f. sp. cepae]|uniref:Uncharacterized protein n=1 Tax=Fusarium oxysporum f. sp. cepae TaxID=396571 RepID=A0A3L6MVR5_FUSOX|nr:hypothetical protein BFJ65_g17055 [Fusarium oxysporum f. sp. cepae]RKK27313.1 hypothetical protein BFJ66_g16712 [Fusarium oxysporum f. sp. cepae]RKK49753.1 hypothetical protein BFJ67_g6775 [Fusarium oxysporum f. sp. cepae]